MAITAAERELLHDFINDNWLRLVSRYGRDFVGIEVGYGGQPMACMNSAAALMVNEERATSVRPIVGSPSDPEGWVYPPITP